MACTYSHTHTHTHTHKLEHKEHAPHRPQLGQCSVPTWYAGLSLPKSWQACLVHGLRSCWFPYFWGWV